MIYLSLFLGFLKVGVFAFGGAYAAIPLIKDVVLENNWISEEMLSYMIAISESTPGPIIINLATYIGSVKAGMLGAFVATTSVVLPCFLIILLLASICKKLLKNLYFKELLQYLKPCMIAIILATGIKMIFENINYDSQKNIFNNEQFVITIFLMSMYFSLKIVYKISPIMLIAFSAIVGIVIA